MLLKLTHPGPRLVSFETKVKRGNNKKISRRRNIRKGSRAPPPPPSPSPRNIFESISLWWRHAWGQGGRGGELAERIPRIFVSPNRGEFFARPGPLCAAILLFSSPPPPPPPFFSAASRARHAWNHRPETRSSRLENSRGEEGEIEPRASNSNVIREQAVFFFSLFLLSYSLANLLHR